MKYELVKLLLSGMVLLMTITASGQVPTAGLLIHVHPVTTEQMDTISGVDTGSIIYNLDSLDLYHYTGTSFEPVGSSALRKYFIQVTNVISGNINAAGNTNFTWINTTASTHVSNRAASFTVSNDGITVSKAGFYKATVYQYQIESTPTSNRNNAAVRFTVDGNVQSGIGANAYIRNATGHEESTASLSKIFDLAAGQKVGINNVRLAGSGAMVCPANSLVFMLEQL